MTAIPGDPITPTTLAETWFGVELIYNTKDSMYETHVVELDWTGLSQIDPIRVWIPPADAQILGMIATSLSSGIVGAVEVQINGNLAIDGKRWIIPVAATPTRADLLAGLPRIKVGAGDQIVFQETATLDPTNPAQLRIHILYQIRWSAL